MVDDVHIDRALFSALTAKEAAFLGLRFRLISEAFLRENVLFRLGDCFLVNEKTSFKNASLRRL